MMPGGEISRGSDEIPDGVLTPGVEWVSDGVEIPEVDVLAGGTVLDGKMGVCSRGSADGASVVGAG
jgi:hypothetical protein